MDIHNPLLRYKTGVATFAQLAAVLFLVVINNVITLIGACNNGSDCAITAMFSMIFIVMCGVWFIALAAVGYAAEERRNRKLALLLILLELGTAGVAFGFFTHPSNVFGQISALLVIIGALWISLMSWRLAQARGGRITTRSRRKLHETNNS